MNNLYKEAMDEINISDQCLRKVKSMLSLVVNV